MGLTNDNESLPRFSADEIDLIWLLTTLRVPNVGPEEGRLHDRIRLGLRQTLLDYENVLKAKGLWE